MKTVVIAAAALMLMAQFVFAVEPGAVSDDETRLDPERSADRASKYPIQIPPASEALAHFKEALRATQPTRAKKPETETPQQRLLRQLLGTGAFVGLSREQCFRAIPTRDEFLNMVRENPADANQLIQRCQLDLRSISPLPQLPTGRRQLPVDTRPRPVGTW